MPCARDDLYALVLTLGFLLTKQLPWTASDVPIERELLAYFALFLQDQQQRQQQPEGACTMLKRCFERCLTLAPNPVQDDYDFFQNELKSLIDMKVVAVFDRCCSLNLFLFFR